MSDAGNEQLRPPPSWDKFEEICADLFARIWTDDQLVRYGREGQRQNGVDIYGKHNGADGGVQCKGKRDWPPTTLTTIEIDAEVEKAKVFTPRLTTYIFATTADNDVHVIDHVNAISTRHAQQGLFRVTVFGWRELTRRFYDYPELLEKHFGIYTIRSIRRDLPELIAAGVREGLRQADLTQPASGLLAGVPTSFLDGRWSEAVERDYAARYERALQRSVFPELHKRDELAPLASELLETKGPPSSGLRRTILLRASRSSSLSGRLEDAQRFLAEAQKQPGTEPDTLARARLALAEGRSTDAIQMLRDSADADDRTVLLAILAAAHGDDAALDWLAENKITPAQLTSSGVLTLANIYLRRNDVAAVNRILAQTSQDQLTQLPFLHFFRGAMSFASVLPEPELPIALSGLPLDVNNAAPVIGEPELSRRLDAALNDLHQALPYAVQLGLQHAPQIIGSYIIWCELLHPARKQAALAKLRRDMQDNFLAVSYIQYALAYLDGYSSAPLESYLARRDALGGLSNEELRANFVVKLHSNDAAGLAALIAAKRLQSEGLFGKSTVHMIEIQALAKSGDVTSAGIVLNDNLALFDASQIAVLRAAIAKAEGADPVAEHLKLYENDKTPETLRALVGELVHKQDHVAIAKYAELLFEATKDPRALVLSANASARTGDGDNFVRLVEAHPRLKDRLDFLRYYAWQLFRLGRMREVGQIVDQIARNHDPERDLQLEIAIAIETGEWEALSAPLSAALDPARNLDGLTLIRAAHLAYATAQGLVMDLVMAAVAKADDDPHVLLGAYSLFVELGLEEDRPEPRVWFEKALALSGPDGPVQRFEIKQLLAQQSEWNRHTKAVTDNVVRGDLPLFVAAPGLRTTQVDLVLRNLIRNTALTDRRRSTAIPLFAGRRLPEPAGVPSTLGLDISALLVLGWLGLLPLILEAFPKIALPAGALAELFEGRQRIRRGQRSRLQKAQEVRDAIAKGQLKILRTPALARDPLSEDVGIELGALIHEAERTKGVVVCPAPVSRVRLDDSGPADMSEHEAYLCDMHGLLKALIEFNTIDEEKERAASQFFDIQDKGWRSSARPELSQPIFLDGLALSYLQSTKLLQPLLQTFSDVFIHVSTEDEANSLIDDDRNVAEVFHVLDEIRASIRKANAADQVTFGARDYDVGSDVDRAPATQNLFTDLAQIDAIAIDDRALNKEAFGADPMGRRARLVSTLDLLEEIRHRGLLSDDRYRAARFKLRQAGAMLVPVSTLELVTSGKRNRQREAPEFRAIRDSLDLARLADIPQFPSEMRWLLTHVQSIRNAIAQIWNEEADEQRARLIASSLFEMQIVPEDWLPCWRGTPPPGWVDAVRRALIGGFVMPIEITDDKKIEPYHRWLDDVLLRELRLVSPELYQQVVAYVREFTLMPWGEGDDDDEEE